MSIQKTAHGTFRARYRDRTGKQITKTFKQKADAVVWEREHLRSRDLDAFGVVQTSDTVATWFHQWLDLSRHLASSTRAIYNRDMERYVLPAIGDHRLAHLTADDIDTLLTSLLAKNYAPSSVHRVYRTIRRMLEVAVERHKIPTNPARNVKPPRIPHREMRFLTIEEVELLADTVGDRFRSWVLVAAYGGLRWGEMLALRPEDAKGTVLNVQAQLVETSTGFQRMPPKSASGRRKVSLPESVAEELEYHVERYAGETIFLNREGTPYNRASFTGNIFKRALVKARLDRKLRIHDLRHTAVAIAIQAGAHPKTIQQRMGHASISVTLDTYGHLMPEMESSLASDIDALRLDVTGYDEDL